MRDNGMPVSVVGFEVSMARWYHASTKPCSLWQARSDGEHRSPRPKQAHMKSRPPAAVPRPTRQCDCHHQ
jgi:hypothetical protein